MRINNIHIVCCVKLDFPQIITVLVITLRGTIVIQLHNLIRWITCPKKMNLGRRRIRLNVRIVGFNHHRHDIGIICIDNDI